MAQDEEHTRAGRPARDMNRGQISDHREMPNPKRSNLREVTDTASIRINQEVTTELTASTENKQNTGLA